MKLVSLLPIASLASLGLVSAADITVKASVDTVKSTAVLVNTGAKIQFCPTGTCDTLSYTIAPTKVAEYDGTNAVTGQAVTSFNAADTAIWGTTPTDVKTGETVVGKAYKFTTALKTDTTTLGNLEITATYYSVATDVSYATKTIKVPAGGVKFAAKVTDWTFDSTDSAADNKVKVDFTITSTSKTGTGDAATATVPKLASTVGSDGISLTTTIGDGMFLDVPNKAITATTGDTPVTANVDVVPTLTGTAPFVLTLEMPNFKDKTLTYDPVMYYTAPSSGTDGTPAATTAAPSTTPAPSGASSVWGYAASVFVGAAGLAALMF